MIHINKKSTPGLHPWLAFRDGAFVAVTMFILIGLDFYLSIQTFYHAAVTLLPPTTNVHTAFVFNVACTVAVSSACAIITMRTHDALMKRMFLKRRQQFLEGKL